MPTGLRSLPRTSTWDDSTWRSLPGERPATRATCRPRHSPALSTSIRATSCRRKGLPAGSPSGATSAAARAIEAAERLAEASLLAGDLAAVVRTCRFGLELDRYQDALWRMLIAARERGGDAGAATRDRREYALVLEALGVAVDGAGAIS